MTKASSSHGLERTLGLWALVIYAVGDILGAGIYALVGKVAGVAGNFTWAAFCVALAVALVTALSYAELTARFPKSGGAAHFCQQAFDRPWLSQWVGWLVLWSGVISLATATVAFVGYFRSLGVALPKEFLILGFLTLLGFVNFRGMRESSAMNFVCTAIEFSGLLIVFGLGVSFLGGSVAAAVEPTPAPGVRAIINGAALAFFAFIGFEDLVNVAEEAKNPRKHLPIACVGGLLIAGVVFVAIAWIAPLVVAARDLAASTSPLVDVVVTASPHFPRYVFAAIALFAVANTALLNFVMASRLLYGMGSEGLLPVILAKVHTRRRTPWVAILSVYGVVTALALVGPLEFLAATTSCLILTVFFVVHLALLRLKWKRRREETFSVPLVVPLVGSVLTLGLVAFIPRQEQWAAAAVAGASLVIVLVGRRLARQK